MLSEPDNSPIRVLIRVLVSGPAQRRAVEWFHDFILT